MTYRGPRGDESNFPVHKDQIRYYSNDFLLRDQTGGPMYSPLADLATFIEGKRKPDKIPSVVSPGIWKDAANLSMSVEVDRKGEFNIFYDSPLGKVLGLKCSADKLGERFLPYVVFDDTGLYIKPSEELLRSSFSDLEKLASKRAVDRFDSRLSGNYSNKFYNKGELEPIRNLFARVGEELDEAALADIYESKWNEELVERLPGILEKMKVNFAEAVDGRSVSWAFGNPEVPIDKIYRAICKGGVNVSEEDRIGFAEVVVLKRRYGDYLQDCIVRGAKEKVSRLEVEAENIASEIKELEENKIPELRGEVREFKTESKKGERFILGELGISNVDFFPMGVELPKIEPLPEIDKDDEMPF